MKDTAFRGAVNTTYFGQVALEGYQHPSGASWMLTWESDARVFLTTVELQQLNLNQITGAALMSRGIELVWVKA